MIRIERLGGLVAAILGLSALAMAECPRDGPAGSARTPGRTRPGWAWA